MLKTIILPLSVDEKAPKQGTGGQVVWEDGGLVVSRIKRYLRKAPTKVELDVVRFAGFLKELCIVTPKELFGNASDMTNESGSERNKTNISTSVLGAGYVVANRFWIAADFGRVVDLNKKSEVWHVPLFTRLLLEVLLNNTSQRGLTSDELYDRAKKLYLKTKEDANLIEENKLVPKWKPLGQFFSVHGVGKKNVHPLYREIAKKGYKPTYYDLRGKWVANEDQQGNVQRSLKAHA